MLSLGFDLHLGREDSIVRIALPENVARQPVNFRQRIEWHEGSVLHENPARLLEKRHTLLLIAGLLLFLDEFIELGVAVTDPFSHAGVKILIIERVTIARRSTGVVEGQLPAVDAVFAPVDRVFLADDLNFDTGFGQLTRNYLANFFALEMAIRRKMQLD